MHFSLFTNNTYCMVTLVNYVHVKNIQKIKEKMGPLTIVLRICM